MHDTCLLHREQLICENGVCHRCKPVCDHGASTTVYRIRHIPTGMYYCPSRTVTVKVEGKSYRQWVKSNLSKNGKLYPRKPNLAHINHIWNHTKLTIETQYGDQKWARPTLEEFNENDWEIVEV